VGSVSPEYQVIPQWWIKGVVGTEISARPAMKAATEVSIEVTKGK